VFLIKKYLKYFADMDIYRNPLSPRNTTIHPYVR